MPFASSAHGLRWQSRVPLQTVIRGTAVVTIVQRWYHALRLRWRLWREGTRIANLISGRLWEDARRRMATAELAKLYEYAEVRAAQLAQPEIDNLLRSNTELSGDFGSSLLLRTTHRAVRRTLARLAKARTR